VGILGNDLGLDPASCLNMRVNRWATALTGLFLLVNMTIYLKPI